MSTPASRKKSGVSRLLALATSFLVAVGGLLTIPVAAQAAESTVTITNVTITPEASVSVTVEATGLPGPIYAALIPAGADMTSPDSKYLDFVFPFPAVVDGASTFTLTGKVTPAGTNLALQDGAAYEVLVWQAHEPADDTTTYGTADLVLSDEQWDQIFPPAPPQPTATTTALQVSDAEVAEGDAVTLSATVAPADASGSVQFSSNGAPLADGTVALADGSAQVSLALPVGPHAITASFIPADSNYLASASAATNIVVTGNSEPDPDPEPQPEPANPQVTVTPNTPLDPSVQNTITVSGTGFTGQAAAEGVYVLFGETSVWSGNGPLPRDGWVSLEWVRGNAVTDGAFSTTLVIPAGTLDPSKEYQVATSATGRLSATDRTLDTFTPVAIGEASPVEPTVSLSTPSVKQGGKITFSGLGFEPGETVNAVVNSDPVNLGSQVANAQGAVSFDWVVPTDFAAGTHTITMTSPTATASAQFTVDALVIVTDKEPTQAAPQCVARAVNGGSLTWGLKASFASYITSPIANGSFSGGSFSASGGSFNVNDGGVGRVNFNGSIVASGHGGLLNMQLSNPSIQITGPGTAVLFAYVSSTDATGAPAVSGTVAFANLSFSGPAISGSTLSVSNASATLTAAGAQAFADFYPAGTALDPVSFSVNLGAEVACDSSTDPVKLATTGGASDAGLGVLSVAGLAMLLGFALIRRSRQTA